MQNKLFPVVHERRIQGILLESLRYRWAAMNPPVSEEDENGYVASEPLDPALADRFAFVVVMPGWELYDEEEQVAVIPWSTDLLDFDCRQSRRPAVSTPTTVYLESSHLYMVVVQQIHSLKMLGRLSRFHLLDWPPHKDDCADQAPVLDHRTIGRIARCPLAMEFSFCVLRRIVDESCRETAMMNTWFALTSYRRATCETDTPRSRVCAQIIRFSSSLQFRRLRRFATKRSDNVHLLTNGH